jgi:uncharacterized repeat protein (TIGR03917 family)
MRDEQPLTAQPAAPAGHRYDEPLTVVSQLDGSAVLVGTQPGAATGTPVVVLRLQSPLLDLVNAVYLPPDQARQVADALDCAATAAATARRLRQPAATEDDAGAGSPADGASPSAAQGETTVLHTVTATERVTTDELRAALGHLPPTARLTDFAADSEIVLIFTST